MLFSCRLFCGDSYILLLSLQQTNTTDMLNLAVEYIKDLQNHVQAYHFPQVMDGRVSLSTKSSQYFIFSCIIFQPFLFILMFDLFKFYQKLSEKHAKRRIEMSFLVMNVLHFNVNNVISSISVLMYLIYYLFIL